MCLPICKLDVPLERYVRNLLPVIPQWIVPLVIVLARRDRSIARKLGDADFVIRKPIGMHQHDRAGADAGCDGVAEDGGGGRLVQRSRRRDPRGHCTRIRTSAELPSRCGASRRSTRTSTGYSAPVARATRTPRRRSL